MWWLTDQRVEQNGIGTWWLTVARIETIKRGGWEDAGKRRPEGQATGGKLYTYNRLASSLVGIPLISYVSDLAAQKEQKRGCSAAAGSVYTVLIITAASVTY
eukprot:1154605-Pelagomonas_calceolata.AAC.2